MNERFLPHVTVAAIAERDGKFLCVEEHIRGWTVFNQPAGHLEAEESLLEAVCRETLEETGWLFCPAGLVGIYRFVAASGTTFIRFAFHGEAEKQLHETPPDPLIRRALWLSHDELLQEQARQRLRGDVVLRCLKDYRAGKHTPLETLQEL